MPPHALCPFRINLLQAVVGGTSCSGMIVSLLRIVTKASFPGSTEGMRKGTSVFFGAAGAISAGGLLAHLIIIPR